MRNSPQVLSLKGGKMFFETHAHYDDRLFNDIESVVEKIKKAGVDRAVNCGVNVRSSLACAKLAQRFDLFYAAAGIHPSDVMQAKEGDLEEIRKIAAGRKIVAIGEIGLDYHYEWSDRDAQIKWFKSQLALANELELPVIIHSREAEDDCVNLLKAARVKKRGVIHCFSGDRKMARKYLDLGYYIGIGGIITYPGADELRDIARETPMEKILLETDSPYLAPIPRRGKRNDSSSLFYIAQKIGEIKNLSIDEVAKIASITAVDIFL
jgi:TatD DNase family protein